MQYVTLFVFLFAILVHIHAHSFFSRMRPPAHPVHVSGAADGVQQKKRGPVPSKGTGVPIKSGGTVHVYPDVIVHIWTRFRAVRISDRCALPPQGQGKRFEAAALGIGYVCPMILQGARDSGGTPE